MRRAVWRVVHGQIDDTCGRYRDHELLDRIERELGASLDGDPTDQVIREHRRANLQQDFPRSRRRH